MEDDSKEKLKFDPGQSQGHTKPSKNNKIKAALFRSKKKPKKSEDETQEIKRLKNTIQSNKIGDPGSIKRFQELPLSRKTIWGLKEAGFTKPTDIQRESILLSLRGLDILGAAKTGSGKTLAFIIPVLEKLFLNLWSSTDGLGALIITPTRELAYQIFETLRKVGKKHDFSAGLIIGGKDLKFERKRMDQMNIVICTPGRLLQHMDENPHFDSSNVQILVLDEADRCLDMGFEKDMNAIIEHLPPDRQTLLFSATQTKSVKDLARLSLKSPVYISVHENAVHSTPETLQQSYIICPLESKLDMLWSFIKHHKRSKILVFLSSCKQVRFVNLLFCRMRPGTSVFALYGSLHQLKRMQVYDSFCSKQSAVLLATDIASRGLDFPSVDWVIQLDCPEDPTTYIHRAGRTARYNSGGESLLVLLPSEEEEMLVQLEKRKIPLNKIEVNQNKFTSVRRKFEALLARDMGLKECGQRAFKAYLKSVFLMKNKKVFDLKDLDLDAFARSLGLAVAPRVRYLQKHSAASTAASKPEVDVETQSDSDVGVNEEEGAKKVVGKEKSYGQKSFDFSVPDEDESDDNLGSLFKSKSPAEVDSETGIEPSEPTSGPQGPPKKGKSRAAMAKKLLKKKIVSNKKVVFDEEGSALADMKKERQSAKAREYEAESGDGIDIELAKEILKEEDVFDKQMFRERIRSKHREERLKKRLARKGLTKEEAEEELEVRLGQRSEDEESDSDSRPNLDWLPDPDVIYGPSCGGDASEGNEEMDDHFDLDLGRKRRLEVVNSDSESEDSEDQLGGSVPVRRKRGKRAVGVLGELDKKTMETLALALLAKDIN